MDTFEKGDKVLNIGTGEVRPYLDRATMKTTGGISYSDDLYVRTPAGFTGFTKMPAVLAVNVNDPRDALAKAERGVDNTNATALNAYGAWKDAALSTTDDVQCTDMAIVALTDYRTAIVKLNAIRKHVASLEAK